MIITPNREFFEWIYDRLIHHYGENPDIDYMRSFKKRIEELFPPELTSAEKRFKEIVDGYCNSNVTHISNADAKHYMKELTELL